MEKTGSKDREHGNETALDRFGNLQTNREDEEKEVIYTYFDEDLSPKPYQKIGTDFLVSKRHALLADEMGLGKTPQSIRAANEIGAKNILVLCPAVARSNWIREFGRFSIPPRTHCLIKTGEKITYAPLTVCSYDLAATTHYESLCLVKWDLLILDEAHYLKSIDAKRSHKVLGKEGIAQHAVRVWALSGTPAPNYRPDELWIYLYTFGATDLKYDAFVKRYCTCVDTTYGLKVVGIRDDNLLELRSLMAKVMLRRTAEDVKLELPPVKIDHVVVEAGEVDIECNQNFIEWAFPHDRRKELDERLILESNNIKNLMTVTSYEQEWDKKIKILSLISNSISTYRKYSGLQKVKPVIERVKQDFKDGVYEKLVIFALHRTVIDELAAGLKEFNPKIIRGNTTPHTRDGNLKRFKDDPSVKIFIGQIQAVGVAIDLTAASHFAFIEQSFVPGENQQAVKRIVRPPQSKKVFGRVYSVADSADEHVNTVLLNKLRRMSQLFALPEPPQPIPPRVSKEVRDLW